MSLSAQVETKSESLALGVATAALVGSVMGALAYPWITVTDSTTTRILRAIVVMALVAVLGIVYGRYLLAKEVEAAPGDAAPVRSATGPRSGVHAVPGGVEIYQSTLMHIWEDGVVTDKEARTLTDLRTRLGVTDGEHTELEQEVKDVLFPTPPDAGRKP